MLIRSSRMSGSEITSIIPYGEDEGTYGTYIGRLRRGEPGGFGCLIYPNEVMYVGMWESGQEHGFGSIIYAVDGQSYTGEFYRGTVKGNTLHSNDLLQEQLHEMIKMLLDVKEDLDIASSTTEYVSVSLDAWQRKFDRVCEVAEIAGVDVAILNAIKGG